ncbi:hypothetical protein DPMN_139584 [Dreissena polymorpha]|uniref:Uncharacterized protein n=1 Tax=Dreissena polymorpha TaxID=45954 RepID=A0A9D4G648_DREPO|nr:hypothetical protein DPMN_139584 [Dreissena polymorpha]
MLHKNWIINVTFSVKQGTKLSQNQTNLLIKFYEDTKCPVPWWPCFQQTRIILELNQDVIGTYVTINLASRVLTWKNAPPNGGHVFQPTGTIFKPVQDIIGENRVTKFYEDQTINVASRVKIARPPGGHVFQLTETIFELVQSIIETSLLTKFHDDRTINVASREKNARPHGVHAFQQTGTISKLIKNIFGTKLVTKGLTRKNTRTPGGHVFQPTGTIFKLFLDTSRVLTRKNGQPPCDHVFQPTGTIFKLVQYIIGKNLLNKFHDDWTINVVSKVLSRTIFKLVQDIIGENLLTNFHEDRTINVATKVFTRKNAPPPGGHIFQATTNLLTKFHKDWTINVASIVSIIVLTKFHDRVLTRINFPPLASMFFQATRTIFRVISRKMLPPGGHVFQATGTIFELLNDDQTINVAFRVKNVWPPFDHFHEDWIIDVTHVFQSTRTICQIVQDIIGKNPLTNFHEVTINQPQSLSNWSMISLDLLTMFYNDRTITVASRVLTRKNAPPPGGHVFQATTTIFELFYDDRTINVAFRVITRLNAPPHGGHTINRANVFQATETIFKLVQYIIRTIFRVLTRKNAPPPDGHVFQPTGNIFERIQDIETNLMTKFYGDWTISDYVASIVKNSPPPGSDQPEPFSFSSKISFALIFFASRVLTRQMLTPHKRRSHTDRCHTNSKAVVMKTIKCNGIAERRRLRTPVRLTVFTQSRSTATENMTFIFY